MRHTISDGIFPEVSCTIKGDPPYEVPLKVELYDVPKVSEDEILWKWLSKAYNSLKGVEEGVNFKLRSYEEDVLLEEYNLYGRMAGMRFKGGEKILINFKECK